MASDTDQEQIEATSRGRRCSRTSVTPGAIAESVPGGALDPLDDEHLDTLRVGVELRPELLPQRREERWCTTKTKRPGPPGLGPHGTGAGQAAGGASGGTAPRPAHHRRTSATPRAMRAGAQPEPGGGDRYGAGTEHGSDSSPPTAAGACAGSHSVRRECGLSAMRRRFFRVIALGITCVRTR